MEDQKNGFTLIEVMIVVAIIAILALIAVPKYLTYVERSRESAVQSLLHNLALAQMTLNSSSEGSGFLPVTDPGGAANVIKLAEFGFRPDSQVGFAGIPFDGEEAGGFLLFGAYVNRGARILVYNFVPLSGVRLYRPTAAYAPALPATIRAYEWQNGSANPVATLTLDPANGVVSSITRP